MRASRSSGDTLGQASAPSTLVVYEDPQCPFCRSWNVSTLPSVVSQFVRTGKIKLEYRGVVIIGPDSVRGLRAIYAAGKQNKLWNFADALYAHQGAENSGWITNEVILAAARDAHADGKAILADMGSSAVTAALEGAQKQATADQLPARRRSSSSGRRRWRSRSPCPPLTRRRSTPRSRQRFSSEAACCDRPRRRRGRSRSPRI